MKLLKRVKKIVSANVNHVLEKAEDPEKMVKQLIRDMDEQIIALRMAVAKAIATEKRLQRRIDESTTAISQLTGQSEKAVAAGNEDVARQLLAKQYDAERALADYREQHEKAESLSSTMKGELRLLENKIQDMRRRKEILIARKQRAQAEKTMIDTSEEFRAVSQDVHSLLSRRGTENMLSEDTIEDSIADLEAETAARRELMESDHELEAVVSETERNDAVEAKLDAIKDRLKKA